MTKNFLMALGLSTLTSVAMAGECVDYRAADIYCGQKILTNVGCQVVSDVQCVDKITDEDKKTHLILSSVTDTLVGELDPEILGDGAMLVGRELDSNRQVGIFEPIAGGFSVETLESYSKSGVVVGIARDRIQRTSARERRELNDLQKRILKIPGRTTWFDILD